MRSSIRSFLLVPLLSCIEDGTKQEGESCWQEADCVEGYVCDAGTCGFEDGTRKVGESCVRFLDCSGAETDCINDVCVSIGDGGGGGGGGGGGCGGTIICNDGTCSPSCYSCDAGCCSGHGGCLDE